MTPGDTLCFKSEQLPTFTERGFISILKTLCNRLEEHDLVPIDTIEGKSITPLRDGIDKPFLKGFFKPYKMEKCEKVCLANCILMDRILVNALIIIPDDDYDLPILTIEWSETENTISLLVDFVPLVDLVGQDDYRVKYLDPLDDLWMKYKNLSGMKPNRFTWVRMMFSPYYLSGSTSKDDEQSKNSYLEIVNNYLSTWFTLWEKAQPVSADTTKKNIKERKTIMRQIFRANDEGAKTMSQMVGKDLIELLLLCNF